MNLHDRIKLIREEKKISQDAIAFELGLSQSQYSRREKGEIKFNADEVLNISKVLSTHISEIYGEPILNFNNHNQQGGNFAQVNNVYNVPEKLIEQYEKRIKDLEERIAEKNEMISLLKKK